MGDNLDLRFRNLDSERVLAVNRAGRFFSTPKSFEARLGAGRLTPKEADWLSREGHSPVTSLERYAQAFARARRTNHVRQLQYLILVPTLRCNLACRYCQVSRAAEHAQGFDWDEATLAAVQSLVAGLDVPAAKIEFQGGEPTLRPDLILAVIEAVPPSIELSVVICTNLQVVNEDVLQIFDRSNVRISTSLDGDIATHARQRQGSIDDAGQFASNLDTLIERFGPGKISALPTIDLATPPDIGALIDAYADRGITSIYLRPVNYQGFARKRHPGSLSQAEAWRGYHRKFVYALIERNWSDRGRVFEETYLSHVLKRIFRPGVDNHVDLRNPNPIGRDYVVIDYDGKAYPTDEARMLSRAGVIDLAIGTVRDGWDTPERAALDAASTNAGDPVCDKCAFQPYCGRDLIDDIARYGSVAVPRNETEFCRRHLGLFDFAFELIYDPDDTVQYSLHRWLGLAGDGLRLGARL